MNADHPDEGRIHAWLDDALGADEAARVAAHVAGCAACAEAVAEARGLIAGASRVVRALDPSNVGTTGAAAWGAPAPAAARAGGESSLWRALRVTPARAAIAATLLVALGITLTHDWVARDAEVTRGATTTESLAITESAGPRDALLDSAIARNIAQAVPPRSIGSAPGPDLPVAPTAPPPAATVVNPQADVQVAAGRRAEQARRVATVEADRVASADRPAAEQREMASMAKSAPAAVPAAAPTVMLRGIAGGVAASSSARECLRIESPAPGARWGGAALPLVVALNASAPAGLAPVRGAAGDSAEARWTRSGDSLRLDLRSVGYGGRIDLAGAAGQLSGTMRSSAQATTLSEVATTGANAGAGNAAARARTPARRAAPPTASADAAVGASADATVPVTARRVSCQ